MTASGESSKLFIDHRFYSKMYSILRKFIQENVEKQISTLGDEDEKKCFYAALIQLF